jgi:F-type H+-transporting ATPase subunit gamma
MCGGFNSRTIKTVLELYEQYKSNKYKVRLRAIGKKGNSYFLYRNNEIVDFMESSKPTYELASKFIRDSLSDYKNGITNEIVLVHNGFKNRILQEIKINKLLPFDKDNIETNEVNSLVDIEPDNPQEVLESLVSKYVEYSIYYSMIDSIAAEHSARMQAMDTASKNAKDLSKSLNTKYNKSRQSAVTNELIEIISGVEAMK